MKKILALILLVVAVGGGYYWWQRQQEPAAPVAQKPVEAPPPAPAEPLIQHPIEKASDQYPSVPSDQSDEALVNGVVELLGRDAVATFLRTTDLPRRVVATVDNLGRQHAAPQLWPVQPTAGNFSVQEKDGTTVIAPQNTKRYDAFVRLVEGIDIKRATTLYVRFYPLFQQAYEDLGYPKRYFNDRLVTVIDHLLQTPEVSGPVQVMLTEVKTDAQRERPWLYYRYVDPQLEALTSGQKILVRMGPDHSRRLKEKLQEVRSAVTGTNKPARTQ